MIGGKERRIYDPDKHLRSALVPIKCLLAEVPLPDAIVGGRTGGSLRRFAYPHVRQDVVIEIDITDFYPSTKHRWVYNVFADDLGCSPDVAGALTRLTTADGHLPQGFNTSTHLGNLLISKEVGDLASFIEGHGGAVTVWIDNIVISGPGYLTKFLHRIMEILGRTGYEFHEPRVMPSSGPQTVCGITVNSNLSKDKEYRQKIIADLRQVWMGNLCPICEEFGNARKLRQSLDGRIRHIADVNAGQEARVRRVFRRMQVDWSCRCR
jgi:hypothetical protein